MWRGLLRSRQAQIGAGIALFVAGSLLIRDAYDGSGYQLPWFARPFSWW
jgi:hypothetical protein